jgi:DNA-binding transcriptional regulator YiaG
MRALKIKNRDLAKWMRVTEETVCRWCRGERPVPVALEALIDVLHSKPGMAERHI